MGHPSLALAPCLNVLHFTSPVTTPRQLSAEGKILLFLRRGHTAGKQKHLIVGTDAPSVFLLVKLVK